MNANYTYSHTIDNATNEFHTSALNPRRAQDWYHLAADRANSDLDVPQKFALSLVYQLPKARSMNSFAKALLNGYQLGSVFYAQSGQPVTLQSGVVDSNGNVRTRRATGSSSIQPGPATCSTRAFQGDVFPVCEGAGGATYVGTTSFLTAPFNGCNANASAPFGYDPAIGYTPVNPHDRYVIAANAVQVHGGPKQHPDAGFQHLQPVAYSRTLISGKPSICNCGRRFSMCSTIPVTL